MGIRWDRIFRHEKKQFTKMTEAEKYVYFLLLQYGSPYQWGKENPEGSDCSGGVCMALYAATGLLIRVTADELYRRVFTGVHPEGGGIRAAFFVEGKTGKAVHVAGLVDEGVVLNSQEPWARVRTLTDMAAWFWERGSVMAVRGLDRGALEELAAEDAVYGLDGEFSDYFDVRF
jgi:murein DD-endopeptidase